jgi:thiol:disulfide interchange protein DsbD
MPEVARKLPRAGAWSELIKQSMAFLLIAVAGYLLGARWWPGTNRYMWIVLGACVAGAIFLIVRTRQIMPRARPIIIASLISLAFCGAVAAAAIQSNRAGDTWQPYSASALDEKRGGHIVLVDFTANWCLNCKYVEATVFSDPAVKAALHRHDVRLLRADLTRDDAPGWKLLGELNATGGIPLTAIYFPDHQKPSQLSSIYTAKRLVEVLDSQGR